MTPTYRRADDHNAFNRELRAETERMGGNPYRAKYLEALRKRSMREIKFRAWNGEKMLHKVSTGTVCIWGDNGELSESKDCVFMQYTGLKDKNGM